MPNHAFQYSHGNIDAQLNAGVRHKIAKTGPSQYTCDAAAYGGSDAACIQSALDDLPSGSEIIFQEGEYNITSIVSKGSKDFRLRGEGKVIFNIDNTPYWKNGIYFYGSVVVSTTVSADVSEGDISIPLSSVASVQAGDLFKIYKNVKWSASDYTDLQTGELYEIRSVSGSTVTLTEPLIRDYAIADTVNVQIYRPIEVHIENIIFQNAGSEETHEGLSLKYTKNSSVKDCSFYENGFSAISLYTCFNTEISGNHIYDGLLPGSGYGVAINSGSAHVNIHDNFISNCRHAITGNSDENYSLSRDVIIQNNQLYGAGIDGSAVIDAHADVINYIVKGNHIHPQTGYPAFQDGTMHSIFEGNHIYGGYCAVLKRGYLDGGSHIIKNNICSSVPIYRSNYGKGKSIIISGNICEKAAAAAIMFTNESYERYIIEKNSIDTVTGIGISIQLPTSAIANAFLNISGNEIANTTEDGINVYNNNSTYKIYARILKNGIKNPNLSAGYTSGIRINNVYGSNIGNNIILAESTEAYMGIRETGSGSDYNNIHDNTIKGATSAIAVLGSHSVNASSNTTLP